MANTVHTTRIAAPAKAVHALIADVTVWPLMFEPCVHAEYVEDSPRGEGRERIRLWGFAGEEVRSWVSERTLDPHSLSVDFRQLEPAAPLASMSGRWLAKDLGDGQTLLELHHEFEALSDEHVVLHALHQNSPAELAGLRIAAENPRAPYTFEDSLRIAAPPEAVYDFLYAADRWPQRLPHVASLELTEEAGGIQRLVTETRGPDGTTHPAESVRVCRPESGSIAFKQLRTPTVLVAHTGEWRLTRLPDGTTLAASRHSVILADPKSREAVRNTLGTTSRATLRRAKEYAETRRA
ncbi:actinorhodin polyketide synthase bifunctional cyclase/dehydratase [Streptomyces sp. NBRC 14336]|uniref:aromatase/cyclase n=1 Tax=Streptomyces sp. NBRC 14336 TaxID=3030992 RepID=UPI0024A20E4A|nr:aromatase/cyclase [Streptomyces sp. NBRC 14336]WBO80956.1 aromatase/cyclase [Streptomyces sp. SBE_14.2]GLW48218.1 actinorhodin polyketide synthase bifunctional cyclase/dehydratase [Streptomyces sp. NBRC 14336]